MDKKEEVVYFDELGFGWMLDAEILKKIRDRQAMEQIMIQRSLAELFRNRGCTNDFRELERELAALPRVAASPGFESRLQRRLRHPRGRLTLRHATAALVLLAVAAWMLRSRLTDEPELQAPNELGVHQPILLVQAATEVLRGIIADDTIGQDRRGLVTVDAAAQGVVGAAYVGGYADVAETAAIEAAGGLVEHFGMPVDPGNLLLLAQHGGRPVLGVVHVPVSGVSYVGEVGTGANREILALDDPFGLEPAWEQRAQAGRGAAAGHSARHRSARRAGNGAGRAGRSQ